MDHSQSFVLRFPRRHKVFQIVLGLFPLSFLIIFLVFFEGEFLGSAITLYCGVVFFCIAYSFVYCSLWKITVSGDDIHFKTMFSKRTLTFGDIESITFARNRKALRLYDAKKREISIQVNCDGYELFVARLKKAGVPGAQKIR